MERCERRVHRRLEAQHDISCRRVGSTDGKSYAGRTTNVSSGGLYFETGAGPFKQGELLKVELTVTPTTGVLEFGGKLAGFAKIVRAEPIRDNGVGADSAGGKWGVAAEFCRPLRLCQ